MQNLTPEALLQVPDLIKRLSGEAAAGTSLRYHLVYDQIKEARREDDQNLPQGVWERDIKKAEWREVERLCLDVLKNQSKDLQVAAWLTEAWLKLYGLKGLIVGLELINGLCEKFWPILYPELNEEEPDFRIAPFIWLNEKLSLQIATIPLTAPLKNTEPTFSLNDLNTIKRLAALLKRGGQGAAAEKAIAQGKASEAAFNASLGQTPLNFYQDFLKSLTLVMDCLKTLEKFLEDKLIESAPSFHLIKQVVTEVETFCRLTLTEKQKEESKKEAAVKQDTSSPTDAPYLLTEEVNAQGKIKEIFHPLESRERAYELLEKIAEFLAELEPHSPTPYLIRRAVRWGHMSLEDIFKEIAREEGGVSNVFNILGIEER